MTEPNQTGDDPGHAIALTADTLGRDLLSALVDELKAAPDCWAKMSNAQQDQAIERLRKRVRTLIGEGLNALFRGQYPAVEATLDGIRVKRGLQLSLKVAKGARNAHEIIDAEGQQVLIVIADPEQYLGRMEEIKGRADQGDLFSSEYQGTNEYRRDRPAPPIDQSWKDLMDSLNGPAPGDPPLEFGGAVWQQPEEPPAPAKSMGQQVHEFLAAVRCHVALEVCEKWTEQECTVAAFWALEQAKNPDTAPARPHWLPIPDPIVVAYAEADDISEEAAHDDDDSTTTDDEEHDDETDDATA